ncbi:MAG: prepilin-type N-terminal cleavage/methylation domain-containing protein [Dehalococcoidia bacterium]|nr:prepilin-type N-terminal cleavage/methylation domain-containing protein [Dehalococcoidia bacterium]
MMTRIFGKMLRMMSRNQGGLSLVEFLAATAISGILMTTLTPALFQMVSGTIQGNTSLTATHNIQNAVTWIIRDGQTAQATDLVDGGPPVSSVTLTWSQWHDYETVDYLSSYSLSGDALQRSYNGDVTTVARCISDVQFSLEGPVLTVRLTSAPRGESLGSVQRIWRVTLRPAQSA